MKGFVGDAEEGSRLTPAAVSEDGRRDTGAAGPTHTHLLPNIYRKDLILNLRCVIILIRGRIDSMG